MDPSNGKQGIPLQERAWSTLNFFRRAWSTLKPKFLVATTTIGVTLLLSFPTYWNETEISRMTRAVEQGRCFTPDIPEAKIDETLLPVDLGEVYKTLELPSYDTFVGLVGMKGSGKSVLLDKLAYKLISEKSSSVVKIKKMQVGEVHHDIYHHLRNQIFNLPASWGWMRLRTMTPEDTVIKVFKKVQKKTGKPVTVLFDISSRKSMESINTKVPLPAAFWTTQGEMVNPYVFPVDAGTFVREVKFFATDVKVMHCAFVVSEGLQFQLQSLREPRLKMFLPREFTIDKAKLVLAKHNHQKANEDHLNRIPRTFLTLQQYAKADDKDVFVNNYFTRMKEKIRYLDTPYQNLIRKAAKKSIGCDEMREENLSDLNVIDVLVGKNLLRLNERSQYEVYYGVVGEAVKEL